MRCLLSILSSSSACRDGKKRTRETSKYTGKKEKGEKKEKGWGREKKSRLFSNVRRILRARLGSNKKSR